MTNPNKILIAVDGGGTGCRVAVGTAADGVRAEAKGGPAQVMTNFDGAMANIMQAVDTALAEAGLGDVDLASVTAHVGLAGADTTDARDRTRHALPYGQCIVTGDRETSVAGVLGRTDGYVIALGTGTIIARQQGGAVRTVNGWGFALSDHASGAWLGQNLLRETVLALEDMRPATPLSNRIGARLGGVAGIIELSTTARPGDYARFAPDVVTGGTDSDPLALDLMKAGAGYLQSGLDALGFEAGAVLSLAGGVGPHYAPYLAAKYLQDRRDPQGNALQGAFTLALQSAS